MLRTLLFVLAVACVAAARVGVCSEGTIVQVKTDPLKWGDKYIYLTRLLVQLGDDVLLCRTETTAAEPEYQEGELFSFSPQLCEGPEIVTFVGMLGTPPDYARVIVRRVGGTQWRCLIPDGFNVDDMKAGDEMLFYPGYFRSRECPDEVQEAPPKEPEKK